MPQSILPCENTAPHYINKSDQKWSWWRGVVVIDLKVDLKRENETTRHVICHVCLLTVTVFTYICRFLTCLSSVPVQRLRYLPRGVKLGSPSLSQSPSHYSAPNICYVHTHSRSHSPSSHFISLQSNRPSLCLVSRRLATRAALLTLSE